MGSLKPLNIRPILSASVYNGIRNMAALVKIKASSLLSYKLVGVIRHVRERSRSEGCRHGFTVSVLPSQHLQGLHGKTAGLAQRLTIDLRRHRRRGALPPAG